MKEKKTVLRGREQTKQQRKQCKKPANGYMNKKYYFEFDILKNSFEL